ncbi:carbohydrate binding domain-containing protein [Polaribacter gangjinensis]|uniref:carbohydrate binding domain-containing protein n=1 Tax=Polaribacter gangjinensis TaxID=574710 RepID=UPI000CF3FAFE|nr:carbohydrate binding domain-containing protein [Polaribacter gangjinensis]
MKNIQQIIKIFFLLLLVACTENDLRDVSFVNNIDAPTNVAALYNITQDNTGSVTITPNADGAVSFEIFFGDGTAAPAIVPQGQSAHHVYAEGTYQVKIVAVNLNGVKTEATQQLVVSFKAPQNLVVVIENDAAISKQVNITANADFATFFEFNSGETGVTQPVVSGNIGSTISYTYQNAGTYNVMVEAKGGAIATTKYEVSFEVKEILAPIVAAPAPPARSASDVVSIFSDAYTDVTLSELPTTWSSSGFEAINLNNDNVWKLTNLDFVGMVTNYATGINLSAMEKMHIDYWVPDGVTNELLVKIVNTVDGGEDIESLGTTVSGTWQSIDIDMTGFDGGNLANKEKITQILIDSDGLAGVVYIDNFYFYKESSVSTFNDGLLTNGDFQAGSNSWIVGVDDNAPAPVAVNGSNIYYSVNVPNAGNPWEVNVSQKVEIVNGTTYTLTFDAWSNVSRSIIAGIGLSADPWSNKTETININSSRATYTRTFTADFGAPNARVLFDLGAAAGQVNIDNVSLFIGNGNLVQNGNFENGSAPWIVGVDDNAPAPVVLTNGNNHYSVNVANAGNPWDVNLSQKLEIVNGSTYTLTFDAWSNVSRSMIAGIGLSGDPWSSKTETVNITTNRTTYTYTITADFGAANARVLFDLGAAAGTVNIDNVSLSKN